MSANINLAVVQRLSNTTFPEWPDRHTQSPGLVSNLVLRLLLAVVGTLLCWVPLRLLYRNGEFAAVVLIIDVAILNLFTILNAAIWSNDNWDRWWDGKGLCDLEVYLSGPLQTIYAAAIFTVMLHLAQQVKAASINRLDREERIKRNLIQASIIFPLPLIQLIFTYFDLAQRYIVGTLIGCSAVYDSSLPKTLVFDAPPALFAVLAVPYAILTWKRFRAISKRSQIALQSSTAASARANRTRRRLYNMSLSILAVYLPLMLYFLALNLRDTLSSYKAYDYARIHYSGSPYPWGSVLFIPSWIIPSATMNQPWVPIATTVAIIAFFGMGTDAVALYRQLAVAAGLARCFPRLRRSDGGRKVGWRAVDSTGSSGDATAARGQSVDRLPPPILPTVEPPPPDHATTATPPQGHHRRTPSRASSRQPPEIPARTSSLRRGFLFRMPAVALPSVRLPSIRSVRSSRDASSNLGAGPAAARPFPRNDHSKRYSSAPVPGSSSSSREDGMWPLQTFARSDAVGPRDTAIAGEGDGGGGTVTRVRIPSSVPASTAARGPPAAAGGIQRSGSGWGLSAFGTMSSNLTTAGSASKSASGPSMGGPEGGCVR
ncbi:pheromone A receptor-domain-containing protein [Xylariomycetidae sp. FL0641]|nr:pheromone A receptor-domain-containing protein [Xylariomycetidae sp. FL0641]